jgi:hypothetical protein
MSTNCVPILASLFKYSYEADFIEGILRENGKRLIKSFNLAYRLYRWCPFQAYGEFKIKKTTDTARTVLYLNLRIDIDNECRLKSLQ